MSTVRGNPYIIIWNKVCERTSKTPQDCEKATEEEDPHVLDDLVLIYHCRICKYCHLSIEVILKHGTTLHTSANYND